MHLTPNTCVGSASQAGPSARGTLGKDGRGEVFIGTSLGESGDLSFSALFMLLYFQNCLKGRKAKLDSFFICSGKLFKSSSASEAWTGVCRSGLGTDGNF